MNCAGSGLEQVSQGSVGCCWETRAAELREAWVLWMRLEVLLQCCFGIPGLKKTCCFPSRVEAC